jgi:PAS domain S-box
MYSNVQPVVDPIGALDRQMFGQFLDRLGIAACLIEPLPDGEFHFLHSNQAMDDALFLGKAMSGRRIEDVLPRAVAETLQRHCLDCICSRATLEYDGRLADSTAVGWWRTLLVPLGGSRGRISGILWIINGTTEQRSEELVLREERDRMRDAIESINEGFALWDADDRLVLINGRYASFYNSLSSMLRPGVAYEELLRAAVAAGQFQLDLPAADWIESRLQARRSGDSVCEELLGDGRWLLAKDRRTSDGGTVALRTEITERKWLEHVVRQSRASLQAMIDSVDEMIAMLNDAGVVLAINRFGAACFGLQPNGVVGRSLFELVEAAEGQHLRALIRGVFELGTRVQRQFPWRGRIMDVSAHPVLDAKGNVIAVSVFSCDVTERRMAEDALRMLTRAVEQSPAIVMITNPEEMIEYVNPRFVDVTGYPAKEVIGRSPSILRSGDLTEQEEAAIWATVKEGRTWAGKLRNRRKNGELFWVSASLSPVKNNAGEITHFIGLQEDITERIAAEEEARDHQQQMMRYMRIAAMGEMAAALAHELNQPIAAVVNYCNGSLRRLAAEGWNPDDIIGALKDAHDEAQRAKEIIHHVARFVRKGPQQRVTQGAGSLVRSVVALARRELTRLDIEIELDLRDDLPAVTVNIVEVEQLLLNLIRNSMEAMADVDGERHVLRLCTGLQGAGAIVITVADTGRGFDVNNVDRAFDPFFTTKPQGMGMGLAICRNIVEGHSGRIWAETNADGGASVHFTLPTVEGAHVYG